MFVWQKNENDEQDREGNLHATLLKVADSRDQPITSPRRYRGREKDSRCHDGKTGRDAMAYPGKVQVRQPATFNVMPFHGPHRGLVRGGQKEIGFSTENCH
jgi:hypothetical protein